MKFTLYFIALGFAGFAQSGSVSGSSSLLPGTANTASAAWLTHFDQFRQQHEPLNPAQSAVVNTATDLAKQGQNFDPKAMDTLKNDAISAFGFKDAKSFLPPWTISHYRPAMMRMGRFNVAAPLSLTGVILGTIVLEGAVPRLARAVELFIDIPVTGCVVLPRAARRYN